MSQAIATAQAGNPPKAIAPATRFWEIDSWRGVAIIMMIIFHLMFDLWAFAGVPIVLYEGFWFYFQRFTATSFIMLAGVSVVVSYSRALARRSPVAELRWKIARRGLHVLGVGLILSLAVRLGNLGRIDFGVLHLIGASIVLSLPFLRRGWLALGVGLLLYATSYGLEFAGVQAPPNVYWLVPLGIEPPNYSYLDYFPLIHWFGVFLFGVFLGNILYKNGERQFSLPNFGPFFPFSFLQFLGRHSLIIYVIHQPILYALLVLAGVIEFGF